MNISMYPIFVMLLGLFIACPALTYTFYLKPFVTVPKWCDYCVGLGGPVFLVGIIAAFIVELLK